MFIGVISASARHVVNLSETFSLLGRLNSLIGRINSLFDRFISLFGRLGNLSDAA
jgi:hypothetical protein